MEVEQIMEENEEENFENVIFGNVKPRSAIRTDLHQILR